MYFLVLGQRFFTHFPPLGKCLPAIDSLGFQVRPLFPVRCHRIRIVHVLVSSHWSNSMLTQISCYLEMRGHSFTVFKLRVLEPL